MEVVLCNLFDCSSSRQKELKRYLISFSKFTWSSPIEEFLIRNDWEGLGKWVKSKNNSLWKQTEENRIFWVCSHLPRPAPAQEVWRKGPHVTNFSVAWTLVFAIRQHEGYQAKIRYCISSTTYLKYLSLKLVFTCQFSLSKHSHHYVEFSFSEKIKWGKHFKVLYLIWLLYLCPLQEEPHGLSASIESWSWAQGREWDSFFPFSSLISYAMGSN